MVEYGVKVTYSTEPKKTTTIATKEFWGPKAQLDAQNFLQAATNGKPSEYYHFFETITRGEA